MSEDPGVPGRQGSDPVQSTCSLRALKIEMDVRGSVLHQTWNELSDLIGKYQAQVELALTSEKKCESLEDAALSMDYQQQKTQIKERDVLIKMKTGEVKSLKEELDMMRVEVSGVREALEMKDKLLDKIQQQMVRENKEWAEEVNKLRQYLCDEQRQKQAVMQQLADMQHRQQALQNEEIEPSDEQAMSETRLMVSEGFTYVEPEAPEDHKSNEDNDLSFRISVNLEEDTARESESPAFAVDENSRIYINVEENQHNSSNHSDDVVIENDKKQSSELMERLKNSDVSVVPSALEIENPILSSLIGATPAKKARLSKESPQRQAASTSAGATSASNDSSSANIPTSVLGFVPSDKADQTYHCEKCGREFENKYGLVTHRWTNACSRVKSAIQNLSPELIADTKSQNYDPEKPFKCERCNKTFKSVQGLQTHRKHFSCIKDGTAAKMGWVSKDFNLSSKWLCKFCSERFKTKASLLEHENFHKVIEPNKCFFCLRNFNDEAALLVHQKLTGHENQTNRCQFCEESFETREDLELHIAMHKKHGEGKATYECAYCPKSFSKEISLLSHQKIHKDDVPLSMVKNEFELSLG